MLLWLPQVAILAKVQMESVCRKTCTEAGGSKSQPECQKHGWRQHVTMTYSPLNWEGIRQFKSKDNSTVPAALCKSHRHMYCGPATSLHIPFTLQQIICTCWVQLCQYGFCERCEWSEMYHKVRLWTISRRLSDTVGLRIWWKWCMNNSCCRQWCSSLNSL